FGANGTYLVYRKMTHNVPAFWQFIREEVERMDGAASVERMLWLASKMVGRTPNGDPLVPDVAALKDQNDFNFAKSDADGQHCPFGSHLRRTNPRDSFHPLGAEEAATTTMKHRILRRGRIYGESLFDLEKLDSNNAALLESLLTLEDDGGERGLHFICVNASISRQFEFIQTNWANNPHFNGMYQSKDPIIGDNGYAEQPASYMHIPDDACRVRTRPLPRFVDVLGGGYFFMPSLTALRFLAQ
ncbi:MAG: peroxidase, partial [Anaerolineae bacterium]|nr:peroxidase [Anaerolineae bacterium]